MGMRMMLWWLVNSTVLAAAGGGQPSRTEVDPDRDSMLGTWDLMITVPPNGPAQNNVTFRGTETAGRFVDASDHSGTWTLVGDSISWTYTSVPDLVNTFTGRVNLPSGAMTGVNSGQWMGSDFTGTWTGRRR